MVPLNDRPAGLPAALAAYASTVWPDTPPHPYVLLADRDDGTVVRCGAAVVKAHAEDTDRGGLAVRMRIAGERALAGVLLAPLTVEAGHVLRRPVSLWPYGAPVDPARPEDAPWEEVARLLAALHRVPVHTLPGPVPPMRGPAKVARALHRLAEALPDVAPRAPRDVPGPADARAVWNAARTLPGWARGAGEPPPGDALCHGDLHLGQLVRCPAPDGAWRLIDVDDLGLGVPAWDLARPAAWYAAGLLAPEDWLCFLDAYRAAGGPAAGPPGADPWPELDVVARALTVQTAALALAKAAAGHRDLDEGERLMVDSCARISALPPELEPQPPS
ncbi:aminoglycoside phosphotransferase family protein [Streptomyces sp. NPDC051000]|uniref:phosphotransferase family protein n=1 Tax=unclassified Streptomyces TaxID=2593676 RepID=UPI0033ED4AA1